MQPAKRPLTEQRVGTSRVRRRWLSSEVRRYRRSYEESEARSNYPGGQPVLQERKIFGFELYIDNDILAELGSIEDWFATLRSSNGVEHLDFNSDLTIPDLHGRNIQVPRFRFRFTMWRWRRSINARRACWPRSTESSRG